MAAAFPLRINYLHYGDALDALSGRFSANGPVRIPKTDLVRFTAHGGALSCCVRDVVASYGRRARRTIDRPALCADLVASRSARACFHAIGVRGFSYATESPFTCFAYRLRRAINLRVALYADPGLFYPSAVRRYLRYHNRTHLFVGEAPAIAFALGIATPAAWHVLTLQSDLAFRGPAFVREHFRGWRKVLFSVLRRLAATQVESLYLCAQEDVLASCHRDFPRPTSAPPAWSAIYERTAREHVMESVTLPDPLNIQLYDRHPPFIATRMYHLPLWRSTELISRQAGGSWA